MMIAAIRWEKTNSSIDYMLIDSNTLQVFIDPKQVIVQIETLDKCIDKIFQEIENKNFGGQIVVQYKSVIRRYRKSSIISIQFHNALASAIDIAGYKSYRLTSILKNPYLRIFRKSILELDVVNKDSKAYVFHLWCVALHATKKNYLSKIKKIWKIKKGVIRMNAEAKKPYNEFMQMIHNNISRD